jgi:hypothetical protein
MSGRPADEPSGSAGLQILRSQPDGGLGSFAWASGTPRRLTHPNGFVSVDELPPELSRRNRVQSSEREHAIPASPNSPAIVLVPHHFANSLKLQQLPVRLWLARTETATGIVFCLQQRFVR